jgi:predicted GNAT family acetyltransferase
VSDTQPLPTVRDDTSHHRFVVEQDGALAELVYDMAPGRLTLIHTEVPEVLGGHGIGGQLVRTAIARATAEHLTIVPWCPFARRWLHEHPDVAGGLDIDWKTPRPTR